MNANAFAGDLRLIELSEDELRAIYAHEMQEDFPADEIKKLDMILDLSARGIYLTYGAYSGKERVGYAFFSLNEEGRDVCILDYFAVSKVKRGQGVGSKLLSLMQAHFAEKSLLLCEVEDPFMAKEEKVRRFRRRRMDFYLENGWRDTGHSVWMFGVDYRLLAAPLKQTFSGDIVKAYRQIFLDIVGEDELEKNMKINKCPEHSGYPKEF